MAINHNLKILELADSCNFLKKLQEDNADYCIRNNLLNAILNRWNSNDTQNDVAIKLGVSKRTVSELEKCNVTNIETILNYIRIYGKHNAEEKQRKNHSRYKTDYLNHDKGL